MENKLEPNFDEWVRLFNEEPEKFEQLRQEMIQQIINESAAKGKKRLEGLQWQIDHHREKSNNPLSSCIKISSMMWDAVLGDEGLIETIEKLAKPAEQSKRKESNEPARILQFRKVRAADHKIEEE